MNMARVIQESKGKPLGTDAKNVNYNEKFLKVKRHGSWFSMTPGENQNLTSITE